MLFEQASFWIGHLTLGAAEQDAAIERRGQANLTRFRSHLFLLGRLRGFFLFLLLGGTRA